MMGEGSVKNFVTSFMDDPKGFGKGWSFLTSNVIHSIKLFYKVYKIECVDIIE